MVFSRLLKSKKGGIADIFKTALDSIRSLISWFFQTAPKPLLFFFFMMFIILLGNTVIPLIANSFGYHCDTSGTVWKVESTSILLNYEILRNKPSIDGAFMNIPLACGKAETLNFNLALCTDCTTEKTNTSSFFGYCVGDGSPLPKELYTSWQQNIYCDWLNCKPPSGYIFNYTEGKFHCLAYWCLNETLDDYNDNIRAAEGATPVYILDDDKYKGRNIVYFKCPINNPVNIRLTFFGLDVFDYRIWLMFLLLSMIIWVYTKIH